MGDPLVWDYPKTLDVATNLSKSNAWHNNKKSPKAPTTVWSVISLGCFFLSAPKKFSIPNIVKYIHLNYYIKVWHEN